MGSQDHEAPEDTPLSWKDCEDIRVLDDAGNVLYAGPRWMRCTRMECGGLVTHGMVRNGGCPCGQRRVVGAYKLSSTEQWKLKRGHYALLPWEYEAIHGRPPEQVQGIGITHG